jgi:hypothetical protein
MSTPNISITCLVMSTNFRRSRHHSIMSLSTRDTLEVPHTEPKEWRRVPITASHLGTQPAVKEPQVRIPLPFALFWTKKHTSPRPSALGGELPPQSYLSHPDPNQRSRLDRRIPLRLNKIWSIEHRLIGQYRFTMSWIGEPATVDPVYGPWTYSMGYSVEK